MVEGKGGNGSSIAAEKSVKQKTVTVKKKKVTKKKREYRNGVEGDGNSITREIQFHFPPTGPSPKVFRVTSNIIDSFFSRRLSICTPPDLSIILFLM
jgi:hypothetical protein